MGRPKIKDQKKSLSVSINIELDELLDKVCEEKNVNKSKYIEYLIKKDMDVEEKKTPLTFTAVFIPLGIKNLNNHIYLDNDNLRQSIDDINKRFKSLGVVYGEYNYPINFDTSLSRVSHRIKSVRIEGDKVVGEVTILNTREGKKLQDDYKNMVFRPRIIGTVEESGLVVIKQLFTFDAVKGDVDAFMDVNDVKKDTDAKAPVGFGYDEFLVNKIEESKK